MHVNVSELMYGWGACCFHILHSQHEYIVYSIHKHICLYTYTTVYNYNRKFYQSTKTLELCIINIVIGLRMDGDGERVRKGGMVI